MGQCQIPEWETQLAGLIARNSASREPGATTLECRHPYPYPRHPDRLDTSTAIIIPACTSRRLEARGQINADRTSRSLSSVEEQIKKKENVLDIVRGQLSAFSNEFASQRRAVEDMGAETSSQARLLKSLHADEKTTKMCLKAAATEINVVQRQQEEANDSTAKMFRQMQRELSELRADVQVLRDENAVMRKQLNAVGVNIAKGSARPRPRSPCSSPESHNDRIKRIVAAAVNEETNHSIRELQSRVYSTVEEQKAIASRDMKELEYRFALAIDNALGSASKKLHLSEASVEIREELAQLRDDLQTEFCDRMGALYVRKDEVQNMITKGQPAPWSDANEEDIARIINERICRLETRQNLVEEQLYEQSSATLAADSSFLRGSNSYLFSMDRVLHVPVQPTEISSAHGENDSEASAGCPAQQLQSKHQLHTEILQYGTSTDAPPQTTVEEENGANSDNGVVDGEVEHASPSLSLSPEKDEGGAIQQAPEWLHSAVVEELKMKFIHQKDRDRNQ